MITAGSENIFVISSRSNARELIDGMMSFLKYLLTKKRNHYGTRR
jgi:hypothetical protein